MDATARWRHPHPTPEQIEADRAHTAAEVEYKNKHGKWSKESTDQLDAILEYYETNYPPLDKDGNGKVDGVAMAALKFAGMLRRIDWHKVFVRAVMALVLLAFGFAVYKLAAIWQQYPGAAFIPFLDMHPLLMLFSGLFTLNFIQHRETEGIAVIALLSTGLNSLLV